MRRARKREEEKEKERWGKYRDERPEAERERESTIATKLWACRWGVSELSLQAELCWNAFRAILNFYVLGKGCCSLLTLRSFFFHRTLELFWLSFPYFHPFELFCPFRCFSVLRILCHSRVQLDSVCPILFQIFFYSSIHIYALFWFYLFICLLHSSLASATTSFANYASGLSRLPSRQVYPKSANLAWKYFWNSRLNALAMLI